MLIDHITSEIAKLSGVELRPRRQIPWASVILALAVGLPLAYWTYKIDQDGFRWWALLPGGFAALMLIGALGMLFNGEEGDESGDSDAPPAHPPAPRA